MLARRGEKVREGAPMRVQRQAEQWLGAPDHNPTQRAAPPGPELAGMLVGRRICGGLLNWAAIDPHDTAREAYPEDREHPIDEGYRDPYGHYQPTDWEEAQAERAGADEDSGYSWGPPPDPDIVHESEVGEAPHRLQAPHYRDYGPEENDWGHQRGRAGRRLTGNVAEDYPPHTDSNDVIWYRPRPEGVVNKSMWGWTSDPRQAHEDYGVHTAAKASDPADLYNASGNLDPNAARLDKSIAGNPLKPGGAAPGAAAPKILPQAPKIQPPPKPPRLQQTKTTALERWADNLIREAQGPGHDPWAGWPGQLPSEELIETAEGVKGVAEKEKQKLKNKRRLQQPVPKGRAPVKAIPKVVNPNILPQKTVTDPLREEKNEEYQTLASRRRGRGN